MIDIYIAGHQVSTCHAILTRYPQEIDALIIVDPKKLIPTFVCELAKSWIQFEFYDTSELSVLSVQKQHIEKTLEWSENKERILIACHLGVSRSSAIALLIATKEWGFEKAVKILIPKLHMPNRLILKLGGEMLNLPIYEECLARGIINK